MAVRQRRRQIKRQPCSWASVGNMIMPLATERCSMNATLRLLVVPTLLTITDGNFGGRQADSPALEGV